MIFTIFISNLVFTTTIIILVILLIIAEKKLISQEEVEILINEEKKIKVKPGNSLLSTLANNKIFIPSACGGGGTCAMCKCKVNKGGGELLSTEKTHISNKEEKLNIRLACQIKVKNNLEITVPEEIFSIKNFTGTVLSNENVATFIKYLNVKIDNEEKIVFKAGGYIQITVPKGEYKFSNFEIQEKYKTDWNKFNLWKYTTIVKEPVYRAYSMANHPAEGNIVNLTVRIATPPPNNDKISPGLCSSYIFNLKKGDKVNFSGAYGEFFIKNTDNEKIYIGGGAGMAPMRSHLFHLFYTLKTNKKISFFYGARSLKENFFEKEFKEIEKKFSNFNYTVALSEPLKEDNWTGPIGFIHEIVYENYLKLHEDPTEIEYYLCGPPLMLNAVKKMLYNIGVEEEMIAYDAF